MTEHWLNVNGSLSAEQPTKGIKELSVPFPLLVQLSSFFQALLFLEWDCWSKSSIKGATTVAGLSRAGKTQKHRSPPGRVGVSKEHVLDNSNQSLIIIGGAGGVCVEKKISTETMWLQTGKVNAHTLHLS